MMRSPPDSELWSWVMAVLCLVAVLGLLFLAVR